MAMGFVMCSALEGKLVDEVGVPVVGAKIQRSWTWAWNGATGAQETVTDETGGFFSPCGEALSLLGGGASARTWYPMGPARRFFRGFVFADDGSQVRLPNQWRV